jgi:hypothetical protein
MRTPAIAERRHATGVRVTGARMSRSVDWYGELAAHVAVGAERAARGGTHEPTWGVERELAAHVAVGAERAAGGSTNEPSWGVERGTGGSRRGGCRTGRARRHA